MRLLANLFVLCIGTWFGFVLFINLDNTYTGKTLACDLHKPHIVRATAGSLRKPIYNNARNNTRSTYKHTKSIGSLKARVTGQTTAAAAAAATTTNIKLLSNSSVTSRSTITSAPSYGAQTQTRCDAKPSKKFEELSQLHNFLNLNIGKDVTSLKEAIKSKFPTYVQEDEWLVITNVNMKNKNGLGHERAHKKNQRIDCISHNRQSYTWDSHAKECMFIVSQHGHMLALIEPGRISACKLGSKDCKIYNHAIGEMFDRFKKYESECHDLVKSGKLSRHFPDHRNDPVTTQNVLDAPPRVIVSLTTIPSRFKNGKSIAQTIKTVLFNQILRADIVWIAVPKVSRRFGNAYPPTPQILKTLEEESDGRFAVLPCEDFGPATKLIPALQNARPNDIVITIDDDSLYQPWVVGNLVKASVSKNPNSIMTHIGYKLKPGLPKHPNFQYFSHQWRAKSFKHVDFIAGLGGVLYKRRFFYNDELTKIFQSTSNITGNYEGEKRRKDLKFTSFLEVALETEDFKEGRYVDDDYISGIASVMGVARIIVPATDDCGFGIVWTQVTANNALSSGSNKQKNINRQFHVISNFKKFKLLPTVCTGKKIDSTTTTNRTGSNNLLNNLMRSWNDEHPCSGYKEPL